MQLFRRISNSNRSRKETTHFYVLKSVPEQHFYVLKSVIYYIFTSLKVRQYNTFKDVKIQITDIKNPLTSERIADGEVEAEAVGELRDVVVAALACLVGNVEGYAEVEADDDEVHVIAQADARAGGQLAEE